MRHIRKSGFLRPIAMFLSLLMLLQVVLPLQGYALTSGPAQPEFSSFEPVSTVKMVNEFSGDLTYNLPVIEIPGPEGSSYPLSLSYHSGASPEEDASWVGYGWTLNPGAIQRGKAGFPDDFKGTQVKDYNKVPSNWTASLGGYIGSLEAFSIDVEANVNASVRYNNYKGFGYTVGVGFSRAGTGSLGYSISDGQGSFSLQLNVAANLGKQKAKKADAEKLDERTAVQESYDKYLKLKQEGRRGERKANVISNRFGIALAGREMQTTTVTPYFGLSFNGSVNFQPNILPVPVGPEGGIQGSYSIQTNIQQEREAYGYLYSHEAGEDDLMDYYMERQIPYDKHDKYLGIPFSSADNFTATGEAMSGGFRLHSKRVGHFHPNKATSLTNIYNVGVETMAGLNFGLGGDIGVGVNTLHVEDWVDFGRNFDYADGTDEPYYFRFTGDMGDAMDGLDDEAKSADVKLLTMVDPDIPFELNGGKRLGRTGYIGYNLNSQMVTDFNMNTSNSAVLTTDRPLYGYTKENYLLHPTTVDRGSSPDGIGEFAITNASGVQHLYSLPVYSKEECNLSFLLRRVDGNEVEDNYKVYKSYTKEDANHYVGNEIGDAYASQYLLTEIRQPEYVDRTLDGPTDDDFGGWTKFTYDKVYGYNSDSAAWYKWRTPYNGLLYDRNELSDNQDDVGTVSYGMKEMYYLEKIETRTHVAVFDMKGRKDGLDAEFSESLATASGTAQGDHGQKRLDKIRLFRKIPGGTNELIKTVNFQYDYSAWASDCGDVGQVPSSTSGNGKLTLRRVWFDYEGTYNAQISPYEFYYQYPRTDLGPYPADTCTLYTTADPVPGPFLEVDYPTKYDDLEDYGFDLDEAPPYDPRDVDPWGNYQQDGQARYEKFMPWMNQVPEPGDGSAPLKGFDPAAYQLKAIKFPSGGEIHVQYEQDDYQWVQDRPAMAMVHVSPTLTPHTYLLETEDDFGIPFNAPSMADVKQIIQSRFVNGKEKMFFKFLFSLVDPIPADLDNCISEFVDGYVTVTSVDYSSGPGTQLKVTIDNGGPGTYKTPEDVCGSLLRAEKAGKLRPLEDCNASQDALDNNGSALAIFEELGAWLLTGGGIAGCGAVDYDNAYFRVPIPQKLGGGLRVKRILMYDEGLEPGGEDKVLYGTEYDYTMENGTSSGVATKEPTSVRMEDPLVNVLDRYDQGIVDRIVSGRDKKQNEGPIGESMLPPASVGYRRIVSKSIHQGKSSPGFTVSQYNTCYDFPFDAVYGYIDGHKAFDATPLSTFRDHLPELSGILPVTYGRDNRRLAQGYRFILFDIHGEPKSFETYAGTYDTLTGITRATDLKLISAQRMEYFMPGQSLPMMDDVYHYTDNSWYPGKEVEIVTESRKISDINVNGRIEEDISISIYPAIPVPIPFPIYTFTPNLNYFEHRLSEHVTTKIERYPAIQKAVYSFANGISHWTENIAFNPETGKPVLSRTTDSYDGLNLELGASPHDGRYHAFSIPASRHYKDLGAKSTNERMKLVSDTHVTLSKRVVGVSPARMYLDVALNTSGTSDEVCDAIGLLTPGSKVLVTGVGAGSSDGVYTLGASNGGSIELLESAFYESTNTSYPDVEVLILESGKRNRLEENLGGFTTYSSPKLVTTTVGNPTINSNRATDYAVPLTTNLGSLSPTPINLEIDACVFKNAYSNDVAIRLTQVGSPDDYMLVELVDWVHSAAVVRCSEIIPNYVDGTFEIDDQTGELVFYSDGNDCNPYRLPCLQFCTPNYVRQSIDSVVVASANTLSDNWPYDVNLFGAPANVADLNVYETGEKGMWRVKSNYKYRAPIVGGAKDNVSERTYKDAGTFALELFNYANPAATDPTKWLCLSTATKYSPYGMAMEERDILGTFSNAHFGYKQTVPLLTAQNSIFEQCYFESFEVEYVGMSASYVEEGVEIDNSLFKTDTVHAGRQSYQLNSALALRPFLHSLQTLEQGFSIMVWVHDPSYGKGALKGEFRIGATTIMPIHFFWEARSGLWNLYEAKVVPPMYWNGIVAGDVVTPVIYKNPALTCKIIVDDVRYQPLDAKMACYVYDPATLKPLCSFDDQHFGTYSQYNGEGKLVRRLIETERGTKTVQENQYHSHVEDRPQ